MKFSKKFILALTIFSFVTFGILAFEIPQDQRLLFILCGIIGVGFVIGLSILNRTKDQ